MEGGVGGGEGFAVESSFGSVSKDDRTHGNAEYGPQTRIVMSPVPACRGTEVERICSFLSFFHTQTLSSAVTNPEESGDGLEVTWCIGERWDQKAQTDLKITASSTF